MSKDGEERLVFDVPASWRRVSDAHRRACTCGRVAFFSSLLLLIVFRLCQLGPSATLYRPDGRTRN